MTLLYENGRRFKFVTGDAEAVKLMDSRVFIANYHKLHTFWAGNIQFTMQQKLASVIPLSMHWMILANDI